LSHDNSIEVLELVSKFLLLLKGRMVVGNINVLPWTSRMEKIREHTLVSLRRIDLDWAEVTFRKDEKMQTIRVSRRDPVKIGLLCKSLRSILRSYIREDLVRDVNRASRLSSKAIEYYDRISNHLFIAKKDGKSIEDACRRFCTLFRVSQKDQELFMTFWLPLHIQEAIVRWELYWLFDTPKTRSILGEILDEVAVDELFSLHPRREKITQDRSEIKDISFSPIGIPGIVSHQPQLTNNIKEDDMQSPNIPNTIPISLRETWRLFLENGIPHELGVVVFGYIPLLEQEFGRKKMVSIKSSLKYFKMNRHLGDAEVDALGLVRPRGKKRFTLMLQQPGRPPVCASKKIHSTLQKEPVEPLVSSSSKPTQGLDDYLTSLENRILELETKLNALPRKEELDSIVKVMTSLKHILVE
jgi:hypothetical protein